MTTILICSCDKYSDLWFQNIEHLKKHWIGNSYKIYIVTDKPTNKRFQDVSIIVTSEKYDFPERIRFALENIKSEYILVTLDDYFVIEDIDENRICLLEQIIRRYNIDYLQLYSRRWTNPKKFTNITKLEKINLEKNYAVNLYPAIWKTDFLKHSITGNVSPWKYEFSLTEYAREQNARCYFSPAGTFIILDVIRKGKLLHKAQVYFHKHGINVGNWENVGYFTEIKLWLMDRVSWYFPLWMQNIIKRILNIFGMKFFSDKK